MDKTLVSQIYDTSRRREMYLRLAEREVLTMDRLIHEIEKQTKENENG